MYVRPEILIALSLCTKVSIGIIYCLISFRLLGLQKDIEEWWGKNKDSLLPYPIRCTVTEALDEIHEMLKNSIRVNANAEVVAISSEIMEIFYQ